MDLSSSIRFLPCHHPQPHWHPGSRKLSHRSGYKLCSLYEEGRDTYIYNLRPYDLVIVLTDAETPTEKGASQLLAVLEDAGCHQVILLTGGRP